MDWTLPLTSPGPLRSPTDISLSQLAHIDSHENIGEGISATVTREGLEQVQPLSHEQQVTPPLPEYTSPEGSEGSSDRNVEG